MILRDTNIRSALKSRQKGFLLNPYRYGGGPGSDPNYASVTLLLHGDGTHGSTVVTDNSNTPKSSVCNGTAIVSTAQFKWGTASLYTDGTANSTIQTTDHTGLRMGAGNFTVEGWARFPAVTGAGYVVSKPVSGAYSSWAVYRNITNLELYVSSNGTSWDIALGKAFGVVAANTWYYFALNRTGSAWKTYLGGTVNQSWTSALTPLEDTSPLAIGQDHPTGGNLQCFLDDLRITKGVGRYPTTNAVPTEAFPNF